MKFIDLLLAVICAGGMADSIHSGDLRVAALYAVFVAINLIDYARR